MSGRDRETGYSKLVLKGTVEQRLTQLDHRETELLDEIQRLKLTIKRLRDERSKKFDEYASFCVLNCSCVGWLAVDIKESLWFFITLICVGMYLFTQISAII